MKNCTRRIVLFVLFIGSSAYPSLFYECVRLHVRVFVCVSNEYGCVYVCLYVG